MHNKLAKNTVGTAAIALCGKLFGFLRSALLAAFFGATAQTDAVYMAISILSMLEGLTSSGLTTVIVPIRSQVFHEKGFRAADKYTSSLINFFVLLMLALMPILYLVMPAITSILAPAFEGVQRSFTIETARLFIPLILCLALMAIFSGVLRAHNRFFAAQSTEIIMNLCWMGVPLVLSMSYGINGMVWGYFAGTIAQAIILIFPLKKVFSYTPALNLRTAEMKQTLSVFVPAYFASYIIVISEVINKAFASGMEVGSVSAVTYATQLTNIVHGTLGVALMHTMLTAFSECIIKKDYKMFKRLIEKTCNLIVTILAPVTLLCIFYSTQIVKIIFGRGNFDAAAVELTSQAFFYYAIGFVPMGIFRVISQCFYAMKDMKTPLYVALAGLLTNIFLNMLLIRYLHVGGLALAASVSYIVMCALLLWILHRKIGSIGMVNWVKNGVKVLIASLIMVFPVLFIRQHFTQNAWASLFVGTAVGLMIYGIMLLILRHDDVKNLLQRLRRKQ